MSGGEHPCKDDSAYSLLQVGVGVNFVPKRLVEGYGVLVVLEYHEAYLSCPKLPEALLHLG